MKYLFHRISGQNKTTTSKNVNKGVLNSILQVCQTNIDPTAMDSGPEVQHRKKASWAAVSHPPLYTPCLYSCLQAKKQQQAQSGSLM